MSADELAARIEAGREFARKMNGRPYQAGRPRLNAHKLSENLSDEMRAGMAERRERKRQRDFWTKP